MNLGQKIKYLRGEKMMTQKELAGNEITRNMLSQIENGAAQPSLSTITYLAAKLGVPAGYLLSEGDEEFIYNKTAAMKDIKRAYADGNFELCRDICLEAFDEFDDELELILTDSCLGLAIECAINGKLYKACRLLDEAWTHAEKTMYSTVCQRNTVRIVSGFLGEISPTLDSYEADTENVDLVTNPALYDNMFAKYASVMIAGGKYDVAGELLCSNKRHSEYDDLFLAHLEVKRYMVGGKYKDAHRLLVKIIDGEVIPPRLLLYLACCDMEICCKEGGDYKGAYEFANNKMEILEHMLIDD